MSFFKKLLLSNQLIKHDGRPLWKYFLTEEEVDELVKVLQYSKPLTIDPKDAALYYAQWWKKNYHGGKPSKKEVFDSIGGSIRFIFDANEFYKIAVKGARALRFRWITKQNTLYFRTLLLQGGLPLAHIAENQGYYQNFLMAVLEEQPESIEDFMFKPHIIDLLPKSSQNDVIYESCFEIVRSILNKENEFDDLLASDEVLTTITNQLKDRERTLVRKQRISKPKNYWLLKFNEDKIAISLRLGLADKYTPESLANILGFEPNDNEYQFYLNDALICIFRKVSSGRYFKTDRFQYQNQEWEVDSNFPVAYVIREGEKIEVADFIQTMPNLNEPSLWAKYSDTEWRLIKGNGTTNKEAALLFPKEWKSELPTLEISIYEEVMSWFPFEGQATISNSFESRKYLSEVNSFDWTIVSQKPAWILNANMAVVQKKPMIYVYDENDNRLSIDRFKLWVKKHKSQNPWHELTQLVYLPLGCLDLKIEKEGLTAYDTFYNIGNLQISYSDKAIDRATLQLRNRGSFEFKLDASQILDIENHTDNYSLKVKTEFSKIPNKVKGALGERGQKKLYFDLSSPFVGMAITDKDGKIISENKPICISDLYGLRILSTPNKETILSIKNRLKPGVKITKELKESAQPLISFKEEITRLYYLADAMEYRNKVCLELIEGSRSISYEISNFNNFLNIDGQFESTVYLENFDEDLELFAIPLNVSSENIQPLPLLKEGIYFKIPETELTKQFIIISSSENEGAQLMPRFVNTDTDFEGSDKNIRIEHYHAQLSQSKFTDQIWRQLLSYFDICLEYDLPFSTFDQLRAISISSLVAARAFFFFGVNQYDPDTHIQKVIPEMEMDLGFCFHWVKKKDWEYALNEIVELTNNQNFSSILKLLTSYLAELGLDELLQYLNGSQIENQNILYGDIRDLRAKLGERVLRELPHNSPNITNEYGISIKDHLPVKLLLKAPIAVAESIKDIQKEYPIWAGDEFRDSIRRNIQYSQYLNPEFYNRVILQVLKNK